MDDLKYPSDEELEKIKTWDYSDYHGLMEFIQSLWEFDAWGFNRLDRAAEIYMISTGGWSGNEDIIQAMESNIMFWSLYWYQSRRGGHYIFAPMTRRSFEQLEAIERGQEPIPDEPTKE
jgi:hypothetical protein